MKNCTRFLSTLVVSVMLIAIFAGCGSVSDTGTTTKEALNTEEKTTTAADNNSESTKKVTIVFAGGEVDVQACFPDIVLVAQEFIKSHSNVTFEWQGSELEEHRKKIKMMAESNSLPDLFWESSNEVPPIAKMGALADYTSELNNDAEWKSSFNNGALDNMTIDGKVYGIPMQNTAMGFFYNKALLDKCGLKIPETWDEFKNVITTLKKNGITPIAQGTKDVWSIWGYNLFLHRYGYLDLHEKFLAKEAKFASPEMIKAYGRIKELRDLGAFPENATTLSYQQAKEMFFGGKAAIITTGTWEIPNMESSAIAKDIAFNWGPIFPDGIADQKIGLKEYTDAYWMGANAKQDDTKWKALVDYIKFRSEAEGTKIIAEQAKRIPATRYTGDATAIGQVFAVAINAIADPYKAGYQLAVMNESSFQQPFFNSITGVINGLMTPEQAAQLMDEWNDAK